MKQAILYGAGDLRVEEHSLDSGCLKPNELYVSTEVTALSTGTDLANYLGKSTEIPGAPDYPRPVGYSNVGIVSRVGTQVRHLHQGQRVFSLKPHQSAYIAQADELLVPVPDAVSSGQASLAYLTQLGLAALRQAHYCVGEDVAVVGLGVIGLCAIALARALGARVVAVANSRNRADLALRIGADAAFVPGDGDSCERLQDLIDVVILTANSWDAYRVAVDIARPYGRLSVLGFPGRGQASPCFNPFDPRWFYRKSLAIIGAGLIPRLECEPAVLRFNLRRNLESVLALMASGALQTEPIISHRLPAGQMKLAYELAARHDKALTGAVFDWRGIV